MKKKKQKAKKVTCKQCTQCCRHVAIEMDRPRSKEDFRTIIWYVLHENVQVFIDEEQDWYIEVSGDCKALTKDRACNIYEQRPDVCRDYDPETCVLHGDGEYHEVLLKTKEDVEGYVRKHTVIKHLYS